MSNEKIYQEYDLVELGLLPNDWLEKIQIISNEYSMRTILDGQSITSREPSGIKPIEVYVVTGTSIRDRLPWLESLYRGKLLEFADQFKTEEIVTSSDLESSININILRGKGSRYEWHVDTNPVTGLLFATTHKQGDGGELVFKVGDEMVHVYPKAGTFITFDARELPHTVMPLINSDLRISIPMNYYFSDRTQDRPDDLSGYLYTDTESR